MKCRYIRQLTGKTANGHRMLTNTIVRICHWPTRRIALLVIPSVGGVDIVGLPFSLPCRGQRPTTKSQEEIIT